MSEVPESGTLKSLSLYWPDALLPTPIILFQGDLIKSTKTSGMSEKIRKMSQCIIQRRQTESRFNDHILVDENGKTA